MFQYLENLTTPIIVIEFGLKLKELQPNQRAKFITRIANVLLLCKPYPKRSDYENVAREAVAKYPFLKSPLDPTVSLYFDNC